jgi:hypothetical protein
LLRLLRRTVVCPQLRVPNYANYAGFFAAMGRVGVDDRITRDWHALANEMRKRSLAKVENVGEHAPPAINFDDANRLALDDTLAVHDLVIFTVANRRSINLRERTMALPPLCFMRDPEKRRAKPAKKRRGTI